MIFDDICVMFKCSKKALLLSYQLHKSIITPLNGLYRKEVCLDVYDDTDAPWEFQNKGVS